MLKAYFFNTGLFSLEFSEPAAKENEDKRKPLLFCRLDNYSSLRGLGAANRKKNISLYLREIVLGNS